MKQTGLQVGAGKAGIIFPDGYFPQDGYAGVRHEMFARAVVIDHGLRFVLISMELPSIRPFELMDGLRDMAGALAEVPREQVWLCMTHSLSAPHVPKAEDAARFNMHMNALENAIRQAVQAALADIRLARVGFGQGTSAVIVSREIESIDGWWIGLAGSDASDTTLHVVRFDGLDGRPIAILYNHALKPCVLEETVMSDGKRYASSDLCGEGSRIAEEHFGVPALFFMGAGGDQFPRQKGHYLEVGADGHFREVSHAEHAYDMLAALGAVLGGDVISTAESVVCNLAEPELRLRQVSLQAPGQEPYPRKENPPPIKNHTFLPAQEQTVNYAVLRLGDCAVIGVKSEVTTPTMSELKRRSPFRHTLLFSMVNGGQSYIADDREFERLEYPALHTSLGRGTDKLFLDRTIQVLKEMK